MKWQRRPSLAKSLRPLFDSGSNALRVTHQLNPATHRVRIAALSSGQREQHKTKKALTDFSVSACFAVPSRISSSALQLSARQRPQFFMRRFPFRRSVSLAAPWIVSRASFSQPSRTAARSVAFSARRVLIVGLMGIAFLYLQDRASTAIASAARSKRLNVSALSSTIPNLISST